MEVEKHIGKRTNPQTARIITRKNNFTERGAMKKPFVASKINRLKRLKFEKLQKKSKSFPFWKRQFYLRIKVNLIFFVLVGKHMFGESQNKSIYRKKLTTLHLNMMVNR